MIDESKVIEASKALEITLLVYLVHEIKNALEGNSTATRAIAINEIRKHIKTSTSKYLKELKDNINDDISSESNDTLVSMLKKDVKAKSVKVDSINKKHIDESQDYFKKYIKSSGINFRVGNNKNIPQYFTLFIEQNVKDIVDGKTTIELATRKAIKELSSTGLQVVNYQSGIKRNIDVFARQQITYASKEAAQDIRVKFAKENNYTIWEFDAHANARPSHTAWQGKRYDTTGKYYPKLEELTHGEEKDYGCQHRAFPVFNKDDPYAYSKKELDNIDTKPFTWNGKQYDGYEATQQARLMEREIRALKRQKGVLEGVNIDTTEDITRIKARLRAKNAQYKDFMNAFGTYPQTNRL